MKNFLLSLIFIISISFAFSQNIGIGTITPNPTAALDITDTAKGILIPRMTMAQRNRIQIPAEGLMVFQTDSTKGFWYWDGGIWRTTLNNSTSNFNQTHFFGAQSFNLNSMSKDSIVSAQGSIATSFVVPSNKVWKIISWYGNIWHGGGGYCPIPTGGPNGEFWINENQSFTFNTGNWKFTAIQYDKSNFDFDVIQRSTSLISPNGTSISYQVPTGKLWRIISWYGDIFGVTVPNGEFWLKQGDSFYFKTTCGNIAQWDFYFVAFEFPLF